MTFLTYTEKKHSSTLAPNVISLSSSFTVRALNLYNQLKNMRWIFSPRWDFLNPHSQNSAVFLTSHCAVVKLLETLKERNPFKRLLQTSENMKALEN